MKEGLDIPSVSEVYIEAHNTSLARTRLQGDMIINHVIDHTLHREERYSHRKCITTEAEKVYRETLHSITLQGKIPTFLGEDANILEHRFNKEVRKKVQVSTRIGTPC